MTSRPLPRRPRRVLITGGSRGLGESVVRSCLARGDMPYVLDIAMPRRSVPFASVDLTDAPSTMRAVDRVVAELGGLDALVTCATAEARGPIGDVTPSSWDHVVAVKLNGTVAAVRAALPALRRSRGQVVAVGSSMGPTTSADDTAYCAAEFGLLGFMRALATELHGQVDVSLLLPDDRPDNEPAAVDPRFDELAGSVMQLLDTPGYLGLREQLVPSRRRERDC